MISSNDLKRGMTIILNDKIYEVVDYQHVKRGRGGAFVRARLRDIISGLSMEHTFKGEQRVDQAILTEKSMTYLYRDADSYHFMDNDRYEQVAIPKEKVESITDFLLEGTEVSFRMHGEIVLGIRLPDTVALEVKDTSPVFKGDTVSASSKPATLETGAVVQVPFFVEIGDKVKIDTRTGSYVERA